MNTTDINITSRPRATRILRATCRAVTAILLAAAIMRTADAQGAKLPWNKANAKKAFTKVLTESARDATLRTRLKASAESAKKAVSDVGNIEIPKSVFILFYEPKGTAPGATAVNKAPNRYNDDYHIFYLPKFNKADNTEHLYKDHLMCCYPVW